MKYRALRFLPLAFLAGTHGFALFAPYVAVLLTALHLMSRQRRRKSRPATDIVAPDPLPVAA